MATAGSATDQKAAGCMEYERSLKSTFRSTSMRMTVIAVTLWGLIRFERSRSWANTHKSPMLKIATRPIFVPIAICILRRKGMGNSIMIRSVIMLKMPIVTNATL